MRKLINKNKTLSYAIIGLILAQTNFLPTISAANSESQAKKIETVLDKLEKRLLDNEDKPFNLNDEVTPNNSLGRESTAKQKYAPKSPAKIDGQTPGGKNLQEIQKKISEYDNRIEILDADMKKLRADIYDNSSTDNQILIEIRTEQTSKFIIRTLIARLDGNTLYNQLDPAGLWMPTRSIQIFNGPLQPGDHRIDISTTLAPLSADGLESPTWKQKNLQQVFNFTVLDGKIRKNLTIELTDGKGDGSQPAAKIMESEKK